MQQAGRAELDLPGRVVAHAVDVAADILRVAGVDAEDVESAGDKRDSGRNCVLHRAVLRAHQHRAIAACAELQIFGVVVGTVDPASGDAKHRLDAGGARQHRQRGAAFELESLGRIEVLVVGPVERRLLLLGGRVERKLDLAELAAGDSGNARRPAGFNQLFHPVDALRRRRWERLLAGGEEVVLIEQSRQREDALLGVLVEKFEIVRRVEARMDSGLVRHGSSFLTSRKDRGRLRLLVAVQHVDHRLGDICGVRRAGLDSDGVKAVRHVHAILWRDFEHDHLAVQPGVGRVIRGVRLLGELIAGTFVEIAPNLGGANCLRTGASRVFVPAKFMALSGEARPRFIKS